MWRAVLLVGALAAAGGYYFYTHSPSMVLRHKTEAALEEFSQAVDSEDRVKVGLALQKLLADDAKIHLDVARFSIREPQGTVGAGQDFTKATFITFIDNTLYTMTDYHHLPRLRSFALQPDGKSAAIAFTSKDWSDGVDYYQGGAINLRYSSDTECEGEAHFDSDHPLLSVVRCTIHLLMVPKPDELNKTQSPEALQKMWR